MLRPKVRHQSGLTKLLHKIYNRSKRSMGLRPRLVMRYAPAPPRLDYHRLLNWSKFRPPSQIPIRRLPYQMNQPTATTRHWLHLSLKTHTAYLPTSLALRKMRYGSSDGSFVFKSSELENEMFAGDNSIALAIKLYRKAMSSLPSFTLPPAAYTSLVKACAESYLAADMKVVLADMKALE